MKNFTLQVVIILSSFLFVLTNCSEDNTDDIAMDSNSCTEILGINVVVNESTINIGWGSSSSNGVIAGFYNVQYGPIGFNLGSGTTVTTSNQENEITIMGLLAGQYDIYVRGVCGGGVNGSWSSPQSFIITSNQASCTIPTNLNAAVSNYRIDLQWSAVSGINDYQVEYGSQGFSLGTGTRKSATGNSYNIVDLNYNQNYTFYVRSSCDNNQFSDWAGPTDFYTLCSKPTGLRVNNATSSSISYQWDDDFADSWQMEIGSTGFTIGNGNRFDVSTRSQIISGLQGDRSYDLYVRSRCYLNDFSDWTGPLTASTD